MTVSVDEAKRIAELARLRFTDAELEPMAREMEKILDYVKKLEEVDTSEVEPMTHVHDKIHVEDKSDGLREDVVSDRISRDDALSNAPDSTGEFFVVPKVID